MWGIPIAHKDLFETKGVRTTAGSLLYDDHVPDDNAAIVQQLEDAGAVMLGKTNTHELGGGVTTINPFLRHDAQSRRSDAHSRRIERRIGRGRRRASVRGGDRQRHRRQRPHSRRALRMRRLQADLRQVQHAGPDRRVPDVRSRRLPDAHRRRRAVDRRTCPATETDPGEIAIARKYFFDDLDPGGRDSAVSRSRSIPTIEFPIDAKTMARVFDPIVRFEIWGRLGADWRTNPGSFSKDVRRLLLDAAPVDRRIRIRRSPRSRNIRPPSTSSSTASTSSSRRRSRSPRRSSPGRLTA